MDEPHNQALNENKRSNYGKQEFEEMTLHNVLFSILWYHVGVNPFFCKN